MKLWERYFILETLKTFGLFILCFYGLYVLIDYASHITSSSYHHYRFSWGELFTYYTAEFIRKADILIPFALLLATVKTLTQFTMHNELVALMVSGVSRFKLIRPFILMGLLFTALIYTNNQFWLPRGAAAIKAIQEKHQIQRHKKGEYRLTPHMVLPDGSLLLYKSYDPVQARFSNLYLVKSADEILKMKYFYPLAKPSFGVYVEEFRRGDGGALEMATTKEIRPFPQIRLTQEQLFTTLIPPADLSIRDLYKSLPSETPYGEKEASVLTILYKKVALPWLCLLAVMGPAPFCLSFSRNFQVFFIYALSIFSLVALYLLLDAMTILGKRQLLLPFWTIWGPILAASLLVGLRYRRLNHETV